MTLAQRAWPLALAPPAALLGLGIAWLAWETEPLAPLVLLFVVFGGLLAVARPMAALCLAVALVPLQPFALPIGETGLAPSEGLLLLTGLAWFGRAVAEGKPLLQGSPLGTPYVLLLLVMVPGLAFSAGAFDVARMLVWWTVFLLLHYLIIQDGELDSVRQLLWALVFSGAVVALITVVQAQGTGPPKVEGLGAVVVGRPTGPFEHANGVGGYLATALPAALALGMWGSARVRAFALGSAALMVVGLALSLSRGGLIGAAAAIALLLVWKPFRRAWVVATLVAALALFAGLVPLANSEALRGVGLRLSSIAYSAQPGADPRGAIWARTMEMIEDHPLVGVGIGAYHTAAPSYGIYALEAGQEVYHAHNTPLNVAAELGLLGLAAFAWLTWALARLLIRACRRTTGERQVLAFALTAGIVALAVQGLVDYTLGSVIRTSLLFVAAGAVIALLRAEPAVSADARA